MLDIRAVAYVSPVSEVPFASVALTVRLSNLADEAGHVNGKFRVYNSITGLLIHSSNIVPLTLAAGQSVDVSALTTFDPPAPATSTYFVNFDGLAKNDLVPDGIGFNLGSFYFDVLPTGMGPAPAAHHATHEEGGSDPIDVADLGTSELDDTMVLAPDGAGGVEFVAIAGGPGVMFDPQVLSDGANIAWDLSLGGQATVTLGGNRTLDEASNKVAGGHYSLRIIQDGTGTRLITWHATYRFPAGVDPCLSAAPNNIDILLFLCDGTNLDCVGMVSAVA
jgi:hypothetical protein